MAKRKFQTGDKVILNGGSPNNIYKVTTYEAPYYRIVPVFGSQSQVTYKRAEQLSLAKPTTQYKVGDKVKITGVYKSGHCYKTGDVVTIERIETLSNGETEYTIKGYRGTIQYVVDVEIEPISEKAVPFYITGPKELVKAATLALIDLGYTKPLNNIEGMPKDNAILCSNYDSKNITLKQYKELYVNESTYTPSVKDWHEQQFSLPKDWTEMLAYCKQALETKATEPVEKETRLKNMSNKALTIIVRATGKIDVKDKTYTIDDVKYIQKQCSKIQPFAISHYTVKVVPTERFIRIGCSQEDVRFSPQEIDQIILAYEKLTSK